MRTLDNVNKVSVGPLGVDISGAIVNINAGILNINNIPMVTMNPQTPATFTTVGPYVPPIPCPVKRP